MTSNNQYNDKSLGIIGDKRPSRIDRELYKIVNADCERRAREETKARRKGAQPIIATPLNDSTPSNDLTFVTDENMYKEIVKYLDLTFPNNKNILSKKLSFKDRLMKGSNSYISVGVDMFLKSTGSEYGIATQRDLETNLNMFRETRKDTGLALRSIKNPNKEEAEYLYNQIKKRNPKIEFPIFLDLRGLTLDNNLNFNLTEESRYKTAECLNWKGEVYYSKTDDFGLPKEKDINSNRRIWIFNDKRGGLSRLYLGGYLDFDIINDGWAYSDDYCRVVLAKTGGLK